MTLMPSYPPASRPLTESRHLPNMLPLGILTWADTQPHIHNHRDTHMQYTQRETGGTHHTNTPKGREEREDTVMSERNTEKLICEWECVVLLWLTSGCKRICGYLDARGPGAVDSLPPCASSCLMAKTDSNGAMWPSSNCDLTTVGEKMSLSNYSL